MHFTYVIVYDYEPTPVPQDLTTGGILLSTGRVESLPFAAGSPEASDVFEHYRFHLLENW